MMFISHMARLRGAALAGLLLAGSPMAVMAQQAPSAAPAQDVTDADIEHFANAVMAVEEVRQTYEKALATTDDEGEKTSLQQEAQEKMVNAIQDEGLTVQQYQMVAQAVQSDPEMWKKVQQHLTK
jgi:hypothetical protein